MIQQQKNNIYNGNKKRLECHHTGKCKVEKQVAAATLTANRMLGMIRRSFVNREEKIW